MKRSKLTESQIVAMLNEGQAVVKVEDICRQYGIALRHMKCNTTLH
ncbi:hypothetical protein [Piscirickettsia salmonis]|nr:hypothetical protein [Piscirickettsia salmonis]QGP61982.1 hypothetical protein PsalBI1_04624 [Piscirickettsia salmonis]